MEMEKEKELDGEMKKLKSESDETVRKGEGGETREGKRKGRCSSCSEGCSGCPTASRVQRKRRGKVVWMRGGGRERVALTTREMEGGVERESRRECGIH